MRDRRVSIDRGVIAPFKSRVFRITGNRQEGMLVPLSVYTATGDLSSVIDLLREFHVKR